MTPIGSLWQVEAANSQSVSGTRTPCPRQSGVPPSSAKQLSDVNHGQSVALKFGNLYPVSASGHDHPQDEAAGMTAKPRMTAEARMTVKPRMAAKPLAARRAVGPQCRSTRDLVGARIVHRAA